MCLKQSVDPPTRIPGGFTGDGDGRRRDWMVMLDFHCQYGDHYSVLEVSSLTSLTQAFVLFEIFVDKHKM